MLFSRGKGPIRQGDFYCVTEEPFRGKRCQEEVGVRRPIGVRMGFGVEHIQI